MKRVLRHSWLRSSGPLLIVLPVLILLLSARFAPLAAATAAGVGLDDLLWGWT